MQLRGPSLLSHLFMANSAVIIHKHNICIRFFLNCITFCLADGRDDRTKQHQTDTACAWLVFHSQEGLCKLYPPYPASPEARGPVFLGSQSCDPAAWLAELQLLEGDIESNPGPKSTLKTVLHTLTVNDTLTTYINSPVQPSQSSPPPLSQAHSPPNSPTSVQSHLQNTPTYHRASIQLHTLYTSNNILDLWMSTGRVMPLLARWTGRLAGLP